MSREIKFRAWDNKNKVMYPKAIVDVSGNIVGMFEGQQSFFDAGRAEIMQYTGLKGKNGREIYEGDIVRVYKNIVEVKYHTDICGPVYSGFNMLTAIYSHREVEVIGNIYENPEVLEEVLP